MLTAKCITITKGNEDVKAEHGQMGNADDRVSEHTSHPDAQWFPDAGIGLYLQWRICSVRDMNISWPMMPGRTLGTKRISDPEEVDRIVREQDFDLKGTKPAISPLEYWALAKDFNPIDYTYDDGMLTVRVPSERASKLVDVIKISV